jgi:hypothetical protein
LRLLEFNKNNLERKKTLSKLKNGQTREQAAENIVRSYLLNCYSIVSKQYLPIADMTPQEGVDYLIKLRKAGEIEIKIKTVNELLECRITPIDQN